MKYPTRTRYTRKVLYIVALCAFLFGATLTMFALHLPPFPPASTVISASPTVVATKVITPTATAAPIYTNCSDTYMYTNDVKLTIPPSGYAVEWIDKGSYVGDGVVVDQVPHDIKVEYNPWKRPLVLCIEGVYSTPKVFQTLDKTAMQSLVQQIATTRFTADNPGDLDCARMKLSDNDPGTVSCDAGWQASLGRFNVELESTNWLVVH